MYSLAGESGANDNGYSYSVTGIGLDKASRIAYRNLTVYLTASSKYAVARAGALQSAIDLYGAGSQEYAATAEAWNAVGVYAPAPDTQAPDCSCTILHFKNTNYHCPELDCCNR